MKLRIGLISRTFFNVPFWSALENRLFADAGLEIDSEVFDSGSAATEALRGGDARFTIGSPDGVLQDVAGGGTLRVVAGNTSKLSHFLIARAKFRAVEDLRGATIGCLSPDEGTTFVIQDMLARHGLTYPGDYTLDFVGGAPTRWTLLREGRIDAGLQSIPLSYMAEDAGFSNLAATADYIPDYQFTTVNADGRWCAANPDAATSFLAALLRATGWMFANRRAAASIAAREMGITEDYAGRAWDDFTGRGIMPADMAVSEPGLARVAELMARGGMLKAETAARWADCIERRYLRAARDVA
jgi:ABC-type nitrate/sulfonate/bicarbonate transport system substrate-binding protein